jgi:hypothetical protein
MQDLRVARLSLRTRDDQAEASSFVLKVWHLRVYVR